LLSLRLIQPQLDGALEEEILVTHSPEIGQRMLASGAMPGTPVVCRLADSLRQLILAASATVLPVLLFLCPVCYHVKRWLEPTMPRPAMVATGEIPPEIRLRPVGTV
jgi:flagellar biosynthesis protein FlhA